MRQRRPSRAAADDYDIVMVGLHARFRISELNNLLLCIRPALPLSLIMYSSAAIAWASGSAGNAAARDGLDVVDHRPPSRTHGVPELGIDVAASAGLDLHLERLDAALELVVLRRSHVDLTGLRGNLERVTLPTLSSPTRIGIPGRRSIEVRVYCVPVAPLHVGPQVWHPARTTAPPANTHPRHCGLSHSTSISCRVALRCVPSTPRTGTSAH